MQLLANIAMTLIMGIGRISLNVSDDRGIILIIDP